MGYELTSLLLLRPLLQQFEQELCRLDLSRHTQAVGGGSSGAKRTCNSPRRASRDPPKDAALMRPKEAAY